MVQVLVTDSIPGTEPGQKFAFWNVDARVAYGASGDDVSLIQFYLASCGPQWGLTVADVDGIWGPKTAAAMAAFERELGAPAYGGVILFDGAVDPMPPQGYFIRASHTYEYKLYVLALAYFGKRNPTGNSYDPVAFNNTLLDMPADPTCPPALGIALLVAASKIQDGSLAGNV